MVRPSVEDAFMITRPLWLDRVTQLFTQKSIVCLSGVRRVGKTSLCHQVPLRLWLVGLAMTLTVTVANVSRAEPVFVRIVSTTNTYIVTCHTSGTVTWTNLAVGGQYSVETLTGSADGNWVVIQSGVSTSLTQSVWVNVSDDPGYGGLVVEITGTNADSWIGATVLLANNVPATGWLTGGTVIARATVNANRRCFFGQLPPDTYVARMPCSRMPLSAVKFQVPYGGSVGVKLSATAPASEWPPCSD